MKMNLTCILVIAAIVISASDGQGAFSPKPYLGAIENTQDPAPVKGEDTLDKILNSERQKQCGLNGLGEKERNNLANLISEYSNTIEKQNYYLHSLERDNAALILVGGLSPEEQMRSFGYELLFVTIVEAKRQRLLLVIEDGGKSYFTDDVPMLMFLPGKKSGNFWCKKKFLEIGLDSIITGGSQHSFFLSEWKTS